MNQQLLKFYQQELDYLRHEGNNFAKLHPQVASHLSMDGRDVQDASVQHLVESFAFLSAKTQWQMHQDRNELANDVINHYANDWLRPIVPMALLRYAPKKLIHNKVLKKGESVSLYDANDKLVPMQVCQETMIFPWQVMHAAIENTHEIALLRQKTSQSLMLKIDFKFNSDQYVVEDVLSALPLYLDMPNQYRQALLSALLSQYHDCFIVANDTVYAEAYQQLLTSPMLTGELKLSPNVAAACSGMQLLKEYCYYQDASYFVQIPAFEVSAPLVTGFTLYIGLDQGDVDLAEKITNDSLQINVVPTINLWQQKTDPMRIEHHYTDNSIDSDEGIYSVDSLEGWDERGQPLAFINRYQQTYYDSSKTNAYCYQENIQVNGKHSINFVYEQLETLTPWTIQAGVTQYCSALQLPLRVDNNDAQECQINVIKVTNPQHIDSVANNPWQFVKVLTNFQQYFSQQSDVSQLVALLSYIGPSNNKSWQALVAAIEQQSVCKISRRLSHEQGLMLAPGLHITITIADAFSDNASMIMLTHLLQGLFSQLAPVNCFVDVTVCRHVDDWSYSCNSI